MARFRRWGARYVATMANHHDNFDLFASSVHGWNTTKVGPMRDMVGEFAASARRHGLKWAATVHSSRSQEWFASACGADSEGEKEGVPYDGNLTREDGKGTWWEGLDPRQLYAHGYGAHTEELAQRHLELVANYRPDLIYFDDSQIPEPMKGACARPYGDSLRRDGSIETVVTVKRPQTGTMLDIEKGVAENILEQYWQTCTTIAGDWFLKPKADGGSSMRHDARSLKELLVDIVSKRGVLLLNIAVRADGTVPEDQAVVMDELGSWLEGNEEAIYGTRPWKLHGKGGETAGGHFKERGISSEAWDRGVMRFTRDIANESLYVHIFGSPERAEIIVDALAADKALFDGEVKKVSLLGCDAVVGWSMRSDGLHIEMPDVPAWKDCNVLKVETTGLQK